MSGHPRDTKKVSVTGAGRLGKFINTEFIRGLGKTEFCE